MFEKLRLSFSELSFFFGDLPGDGNLRSLTTPDNLEAKTKLDIFCSLPLSCVVFLHFLLSAHFPLTGLSATHFCADWLINWSLAAKWARLLITQLTVAYPTH